MKKDYTVLLIQLDRKLSHTSYQVESREPCNLSSFIYTVEKFTIGYVVAQRGRLNYITNACTRMCTSLTDHVTLSIS